MKRLLIAVPIIAILLFGLGRMVGGSVSPHLYAGTVLQESEPAPSMTSLVYGNGDPVDLTEFSDEVVVVYFGYTNCPDVCPTTLSSTATALLNLNEDERDRVEMLMVTVDPERDGPAELQEYVAFFDPEFRGVSGERVDIDAVASRYGIFHEAGEGDIESGYLVDHTATLLAIGTDGALRIVWPPTVSSSELTSDIKELLKQ